MLLLIGGNVKEQEIMTTEQSHIMIRICTKQPVEVVDMTLGLMSIADQYAEYISNNTKDASENETKLYVSGIEEGSIIARLIAHAHSMVSGVGDINTYIEFVNNVKTLVSPLLKKGGTSDASTKSLNKVLNTVKTIAADSGGNMEIAAVKWTDKKAETELSLTFNTSEARIVEENIKRIKAEREQRGDADYPKVLMRFNQANIKAIKSGKSTGEKAIIESITSRELPVIYVSDVAGQKIKGKIVGGDENPFKLGFVVDVNVELQNGDKPIAYRVVHLHNVVDIDTDDDTKGSPKK